MRTIKTQPLDISTRQLHDHMLRAVREEGAGVELETGEVVATLLAEYVADDLGCLEWLDDEDHPIWDIAADVAAAFPGGA